MTKRRTIAFYLPNLAGGGVERISLLLVPAFIKAGYDVTFLLHKAEGDLIGSVPPQAQIIDLNVPRTLAALFPLIRYFRKERPDIVLSSLGHNNINAVWASVLSRTGVPVVMCQHNALSAETVKGQEMKFSPVLPRLYRFFWRYAKGIVAVSHGIAADMACLAHIPLEKIDVIYNPIVTEDFEEKASAPCDHPWFGEGLPPVVLGVGRFVEQKDFPTLLDAFAALLKKKEARLILLGKGALLAELKARALSLGIAEHVDFPGFVANPLPFMKRAAMLVMSSSHEGFGNVLAEALACGTPVVSTNCDFGPSEILDSGRYGKLVPVGDSEGLAEAMRKTLDTPPPCADLQARGMTFTVEKAANQYLAVFDRIISGTKD